MILIIDNYDSFTFNLYQMMATQFANIKVVRNDQVHVDDVHAMQPLGIVLSPGPGRPERAGICVDLIRHPKTTMPVLGVCLGHQAIVVAFGGQVVRAPDIVHGKQDMVHHRGTFPLYHRLPLPFRVGRYHSLMACKDSLPSELCVESETESGLIMGVRHRERPIYGVQFHPESILTHHGCILLNHFIQSCVGEHDVAA